MTSDQQLSGINILVTRPAHQAVFLTDRIGALGGNPILFPVLEITDIEDPTSLNDVITRLNEFDWAIFVSPNAVNKAMPLIIKQHPILPSHLRIAVVGKGSADALKRYGIKEVLVPTEQFDSESLLKLNELQNMPGKRVVIFRGDGGRQLLGDTLIQRGANVEYVACYHRDKPSVDTAPLLAAWSQNQINAVIITSSEGLHNLFDIIGSHGQQLLKSTPIFTVHERIAQTAKDLGLEKIVYLPSQGDEGLLKSLNLYFNSKLK